MNCIFMFYSWFMPHKVKKAKQIIFFKMWSKLSARVYLWHWLRNCIFIWTESVLSCCEDAILSHNLDFSSGRTAHHLPLKCYFKQAFLGTFWLGFSRSCAAEYLIPLRRRECQVVNIWYLENTTLALLSMDVTAAEEQLGLWYPPELFFKDL